MAVPQLLPISNAKTTIVWNVDTCSRFQQYFKDCSQTITIPPFLFVTKTITCTGKDARSRTEIFSNKRLK